jgi:hypothetical protein
MVAKESSNPDIKLLHASAAGCNTVTTREILQSFMNEVMGDHEQEKAEYIEKRDEEGRTAFFIACCSGRRKNLLRYMRLLKGEGADVMVKDNYGNNLMHAVAMANTRKISNTSVKKLRGNPGGGACKPSLHQLYLWCPGLLLEENMHGDTPLRIALRNKNEFVVAAILAIAGRYKTGFVRGLHDTLRDIPDVPGYLSLRAGASRSCDPDLGGFLQKQETGKKSLLSEVMHGLVMPFDEETPVKRIVGMLRMLLAANAHVTLDTLRAIQYVHIKEREIRSNKGLAQERLLSWDVLYIALLRCQNAYKLREEVAAEYENVHQKKFPGEDTGESEDLDHQGMPGSSKRTRVAGGDKNDHGKNAAASTTRVLGIHDKKYEDNADQDRQGIGEEGSGEENIKGLLLNAGKYMVYRELPDALWDKLVRDQGETRFIVSALKKSRDPESAADDDEDEESDSDQTRADTEWWVAEDADIAVMGLEDSGSAMEDAGSAMDDAETSDAMQDSEHSGSSSS